MEIKFKCPECHGENVTATAEESFMANTGEHCGEEAINSYGYDDDNYHNNVIPNMECKSCGKKAPIDYGEH